MSLTSEDLWGGLYAIGSEDLDLYGTPSLDVIAKLVEFKMVTMIDREPRLTEYGHKCFQIMTSGNGVVPELDYFNREPFEV